MAGIDALQQLGLTVGRVVAAQEHAGARAPSYLLTIDLGPSGERQGSVLRSGYGVGDLVGRQVVCLVDGDDVIVLGAHSHARGIVLLRPDDDVEEGSIVA